MPGCLGMNFETSGGDAREEGSGLDLTGGFITLRDRTAVLNLRFANLDLAAYPQPDDLYKTVRASLTVGSGSYFVAATYNRIGSESYTWGSPGPSGTKRNRGEAHVGEGGVVEMDLPFVKPGATVAVGEVRTESYKFGGVEFAPDENITRRTMDLAQGTSQTIACPAAPVSTSEPQAQPEPTAAPPAGGDQPASTAPSVQVPHAVTLRARRLRGGRVRLTGRASFARDGARVVLRRGRKVVARTVMRNGRFSVVTRRAPRGAGVKARVAGRTSALVRVP